MTGKKVKILFTSQMYSYLSWPQNILLFMKICV